MNRISRIALLAVLIPVAGCYHVTVETGLRPGTETIAQKWASSWVAGLVPPKTVATMERCPSGVARVETKLSFLNQLVGALTGGIYTPMEIRVTCADPSMQAAGDPRVADRAQLAAALGAGGPFLIDLGTRAGN